MKKLICMILALVMVMSLCACGQQNADENKGDDNKNETTTQDDSNNTQDEPENEDNKTEDNNTETKDPTKLTGIDQITFTVNGTTFHLGMKLSEILDSGVFTDFSCRDEELEEVEAGGAYVTVAGTDGPRILLYLWNLSRQTIDVKDATVVGLSYNLDGEDSVVDVSFEGVTLNTSVKDLTSLFGKPNVHEKTYENETSVSGGWRGFDIGEQFRLYITAEQPKGKALSHFELQFKPFASNIK